MCASMAERRGKMMAAENRARLQRAETSPKIDRTLGDIHVSFKADGRVMLCGNVAGAVPPFVMREDEARQVAKHILLVLDGPTP